MTPETHRLALRAAAKLALSALAPTLALACGSAATEESPAPTTSVDLTSAHDAGTPKEVALYCAAEAPEKTPRECCDTELATATFGDDAGTNSLTLGCCDVLIHSANPWSSEQLGECCFALGTPHGPACTPWGPPVPPAMGWKRGTPSAHQVLAA